MDDQALYIRHIGQQRKELKMVDPFVGFRLTALDLKRKDGSAAVGEILLIKRVVGMVGQRGVVDMLHQGVLGHTALVFSACRSKRSERVSTPWSSRKALKGERVAPVSRSRMARM